jgi:hypothetical protein
MPKLKSVETGGKWPDTCILKMGKSNNVIQWRDEMYNLATEEFGEVGTYFHTNVAYKYPFPHEREYNPFYVEPAEQAIIEEDEDHDENKYFDADEDNEGEEEEGQQEAVPAPDLPEATRVALINKLREGAYEARRKRKEAALQ